MARIIREAAVRVIDERTVAYGWTLVCVVAAGVVELVDLAVKIGA